MASPVASNYPQSLQSPPPVYLPSSPPQSPSRHEATPRSNPKFPPRNSSVARKPLPAVPHTAPHIKLPPVPSLSVNGHPNQTETPSKAAQNPLDDSFTSNAPSAALFNLSLEDTPANHGMYPPRKESVGALPLTGKTGYRHTPASSISSFAAEPRPHDETQTVGQTSGSSFDHDAPSGSQNTSSRGSLDSMAQVSENFEPLHYHHRPYQPSQPAVRSTPTLGLTDNFPGANSHLSARRPSRPLSAYSFASDNGSPQASPYLQPRTSSRNSSSPDVRPVSFVDLLNAPYPQPGPAPAQFGNAHLRSSVGNNASLLSHKQTFDMYLGNVKKTDDAAVQYEFAIFMVNAMLEMPDDELEGGKPSIATEKGKKSNDITRSNLLKEAKSILQGLANRSYPFAQYYLADGYASGLFSKGKEDYDRAFPLFVAASKHGHVEACYRTALCYEFGWGTRTEASRAQQFYRQAASKNHPGAMLRMAKACLAGDMGLGKRYREGIKWLKRAAESSDAQYNSAPYELGVLHESGYGDDVFADPSYAAQLFTKSADLGHAEASYRLGDAYEHGNLNCPKDPALSIHFYTNAAQGGHTLAMMALCAWYLVGAEPVLEKDENEAYEWAKRAAELGLAKAQYAVGYFTEMGIGCRRDPLEANVWYVKAADQGDTRAMQRIAAIRAAADGVTPAQAAADANGGKIRKNDNKQKRFGIF
ncbi:putative chitin synthase activator (Chs3) [Aspergillus lucknowensis]|uniref:HCP-like protein n=1 Tax=Aspergillus lucknowensis TaxID=176173 RepID=A0ABR4LZW2_9EURO